MLFPVFGAARVEMSSFSFVPADSIALGNTVFVPDVARLKMHPRPSLEPLKIYSPSLVHDDFT